jgi:hypothetical protein
MAISLPTRCPWSEVLRNMTVGTAYREDGSEHNKFYFDISNTFFTCTISNRVQFSLKTRVQFNAIRQQMKQKKARVQFYMYVIRHQMK